MWNCSAVATWTNRKDVDLRQAASTRQTSKRRICKSKIYIMASLGVTTECV